MKVADMGQVQRGIVLHIKGAELIEHLKKRIEYHKSRKEAYKTQAIDLEALIKSGDQQAKSIGKGSLNNNPLEAMESSMQDHERKERFFSFACTHMVEDMTYECAISDLVTYEVAPTGIRQY